MIDEWENDIAIEQQSFAFTGMGDIGQLVGRDVQGIGENLPVASSLVQHDDKVRVLKDILNFPAGQQVFHILGDTSRAAAPFPKPLPDFHGIGSGLFLFEEQVELIDIVPGTLASRAVGGNTPPYLVLNNQHTDFLHLLAQLLDVVADKAVVHIHIGSVVEQIQRAFDIDFQRRCHMPRLFFLLH